MNKKAVAVELLKIAKCCIAASPTKVVNGIIQKAIKQSNGSYQIDKKKMKADFEKDAKSTNAKDMQEKIEQIEFLQEKPWIFTGGIANQDSDVITSLLNFALKEYKKKAKELGV